MHDSPGANARGRGSQASALRMLVSGAEGSVPETESRHADEQPSRPGDGTAACKSAHPHTRPWNEEPAPRTAACKQAPSSPERGAEASPPTPRRKQGKGAPSGGRAGAARSRENRLRDPRLVRFSPRAKPALPPDGADDPTNPSRLTSRRAGRTAQRDPFHKMERTNSYNRTQSGSVKVNSFLRTICI